MANKKCVNDRNEGRADTVGGERKKKKKRRRSYQLEKITSATIDSLSSRTSSTRFHSIYSCTKLEFFRSFGYSTLKTGS